MDKDNWEPLKFQDKDKINWADFARSNGVDFDFNPDAPDEDMVNSPAHYTKGRYEAIDVIEDAIEEAPSVKTGMLQAQALKYLLRLWHKIDAKEDAEKARWYLNRLIDSLN